MYRVHLHSAEKNEELAQRLSTLALQFSAPSGRQAHNTISVFSDLRRQRALASPGPLFLKRERIG